MKKKFYFIVPFLVLALVFGFALACGGGSNPEQKQKEEFSEVDAWVAAQLEVENNLKSPATAKFPMGYSDYVKKTDTDEYFVEAYVDSENSFGAMIRTQFSCYVTHLGNGKYKVEDLNMWE